MPLHCNTQRIVQMSIAWNEYKSLWKKNIRGVLCDNGQELKQINRSCFFNILTNAPWFGQKVTYDQPRHVTHIKTVTHITTLNSSIYKACIWSVHLPRYWNSPGPHSLPGRGIALWQESLPPQTASSGQRTAHGCPHTLYTERERERDRKREKKECCHFIWINFHTLKQVRFREKV